jgi:hypothetical protein
MLLLAFGVKSVISQTKAALHKEIVDEYFSQIRPRVRQTSVSFILINVGYFVLAPLIDKIWDVTDRDQFVAERKEAIIDLFLHGVKTQ